MLNKKEEKEQKYVKESEIIEYLEKEFKWNFLQPNDVQAAYLVGLLFQMIDYDQQSVLKTRGLRKKMRYLFNNLNKEKLEKIFQACIEVQLAVMDKLRAKKLKHSLIRQLAEEKLMNATYSSPSEQLSLAFMKGFDLFLKIFSEKYPKEFETIIETEDEIDEE